MITYPIVAPRHSMTPATIFMRQTLPMCSGDEVRYVQIEHLPSGRTEQFAQIDEADQQRWMERQLLEFPTDQPISG